MTFIKENNFPVTRAQTMNAGDATFHYGYTIHSAPGNNSDVVRSIMTVIYVADGARVSEPKQKYQINDREKWLMNKPIGDLIDSELNPLLL